MAAFSGPHPFPPSSRPSTAGWPSGPSSPDGSLSHLEPAARPKAVHYNVVLPPEPDEAVQYFQRKPWKMREHLSFDNAKSGGYQRPGTPLQRGGLYRAGLFGKPSLTVLWGPASVQDSLERSPHLKHHFKRQHNNHHHNDHHGLSPAGSARADSAPPAKLLAPLASPRAASGVAASAAAGAAGGGGGGSRGRPQSAMMVNATGGKAAAGGGGSPQAASPPVAAVSQTSASMPSSPRAAEVGGGFAGTSSTTTTALGPLPSSAASAIGGAGGGGGLSSARSIYEALRGHLSSSSSSSGGGVSSSKAARMLPVRLLRASWIIEQAREVRRARRGGTGPLARRELQRCILRRRQDLPEEAFLSVSDVERLHPIGGAAAHRVAVFAASYAWRTEAHPDPEVCVCASKRAARCVLLLLLLLLLVFAPFLPPSLVHARLADPPF